MVARGDSQHDAVEAIQHSSVSRQYVAGVFYSERAFQQGFDQVSPSSEQDDRSCQSQPI